MIKTKADLKEYIEADESRYTKRKYPILGWLLGDEGFVVKRYLRLLRNLEYYTNKERHLFDYVPYLYYLIRFRRARIRTGIQLKLGKQRLRPESLRWQGAVGVYHTKQDIRP